jgi:hypothetical protein
MTPPVTLDERLDRLTGIVQPLVPKVAARTSRIEKLVQTAEKQRQEMKDLLREWQAYLRTLPKQ